MSTKTASMISAVMTAVLTLFVVVTFGFGGIILLNGFMNADAAIYTGFTCLGLTLILCPMFAWALARTFISRFNWNNILSISVSVVVSTLLASGMGFASTLIMAIVAETM